MKNLERRLKCNIIFSSRLVDAFIIRVALGDSCVKLSHFLFIILERERGVRRKCKLHRSNCTKGRESFKITRVAFELLLKKKIYRLEVSSTLFMYQYTFPSLKES